MTRNTSFVCTSLLTTAEFPLIIRSRPDNAVHIRGGLLVASQNCVRVQGLYLDSDLTFQACTNAQLVSCAIRGNITVTNATAFALIGNTLDTPAGATNLTIHASSEVSVKNNIFLRGSVTASPLADIAPAVPSHAYNCYWPTNGAPAEPHGVYADPDLDLTGYYPTNLASPVIDAAVVNPISIALTGIDPAMLN
jgi:hypothetical protein